jgi:hypothetical protein
VVEAQGKAKLVLPFLVGRTSGGGKDDGLSSALDGVLGLTEAGGIAGVELRWLAIGAVKQGNGCSQAILTRFTVRRPRHLLIIRTGKAARQLSRLLKLKSRVWPLRVPLIGQPNYPSEERRDCGNAHRRICERVKEDD